VTERIVVTIDRDRCMGTGLCVYHAADVFDLDEEGRSVVVRVRPEDTDAVLIAAEACPTQAIGVVTGDADHPSDRSGACS
jgi:ferredoxin